MHLINYLQTIYASLVAGHVFCTSNGMLNWFENQLPCAIYLDLQEPYGTKEPPNHTFSRKVHDISSSPGKPASFLQKVSFEEVKKGNVSTENNIDESFSPSYISYTVFFLSGSLVLQEKLSCRIFPLCLPTARPLRRMRDLQIGHLWHGLHFLASQQGEIFLQFRCAVLSSCKQAFRMCVLARHVIRLQHCPAQGWCFSSWCLLLH